MKVLAIDLSSARGGVAVAEDNCITREQRFASDRGRGVGVFAALEAMRDAWRGADLVAVGVGPGSYNGLRTACALANSIQMATGARLCSTSSPCVSDVGDEHFFIYGDARGGRAYRAEVRNRILCGEIALLEYAQAAETAKNDGGAYRIGPLACLDWLPEANPDAKILATLAPALPTLSPAELRPIYLKPPHITMPGAVRT